MINKGQGSVQREIQNLLTAEIIEKREESGRTFYQVNKQSPIYPDLKMMILKTEGLVTVLQESLKPLKNQIEIAFIFGSLSRGVEQAESDVDLAVIGSTSFEDVVGAIRPTQKVIRREINPFVIEMNEFTHRNSEGDHFINELLKSEKLFLIGNPDDIEAMVR